MAMKLEDLLINRSEAHINQVLLVVEVLLGSYGIVGTYWHKHTHSHSYTSRIRKVTLTHARENTFFQFCVLESDVYLFHGALHALP